MMDIFGIPTKRQDGLKMTPVDTVKGKVMAHSLSRGNMIDWWTDKAFAMYELGPGKMKGGMKKAHRSTAR